MKKIFFSMLLVLFVFVSGYSQSQSTTLEKSRMKVCGSTELVNGEAVIAFNQSENVISVVVSLTPVEGFMQLYVAKKETGKIVIKAVNTSAGKFDYIIYETIAVPAPTNKKDK